jgi:histidinol-phosphate/aromatic aminotransferase/cobyric acid decarboxylase-like protein
MKQDDFFDKDDYTELNKKFFLPLRESGDMTADPSGWMDTYSNVGEYEPFTEEVQRYYSDFYNQLNPIKNRLLPLFSSWDAISLSAENITLCHSVTVGSAIILAFLISKGIKTIILETPCYFATYYQAETFGFNIIKIPTFHNENYQLTISADFIIKNSPCAVFLTQPRTALGINQNDLLLKKISEGLGKNSYLIIDEATEQYFPSKLCDFNFTNYENVFKIRSVFKGMGVNGIRLAYIIHHENYRNNIADQMETMQGALDVHSLKLASDIAQDIGRFKHLLTVANNQVTTLYKKAVSRVAASNCFLSPISNGYIGSVAVKLSHENRRAAFIEYCASNRMPLIIGASMGFARHSNMEFVRLNYFNREHNILKGLDIMASFK